ncbi:HlyD family secretion protein [Inhella inkyongensis]|uniref:HlyD family secretion protein n=1 Tax=Inhella inkyongensis TaxID=392593 RepID=A0A840S423_9BURK|nr:efflux RND transporter periplasmic adaptor subunit [Inhella inkyongensis]MBB5203796.1 HlyD family secretion protein [Inhella inkyongensis]
MSDTLTLTAGSPPKLRRLLTWLLLALLLALGLSLGLAWRQKAAQAGAAQSYPTLKADRGLVQRSLHATGTVKPLSEVQIGSAISGTVARVLVDHNDAVQAGALLAQLDTRSLDADVAAATAALAVAQSNRGLAEQRLRRASELHAQGFYAQAELDDARSALTAAGAQAEQAQAQLQRSRVQRAHAEIRAPAAGVVVAREVTPGQTVAATLNSPVLFRIAEDLRELRIEAAVSEADIAQLREGQNVRFTVDAQAGREFEGRITQIRNNYSVQQNVVTYTVLVAARNEDLALRPGMTAYLKVEVARREQALRVPNAALRYPGPAGRQASPVESPQVWRLNAQGQPEAVAIQTGLADTRNTEVLGGPLRDGDVLIVGAPQAAAAKVGPKLF